MKKLLMLWAVTLFLFGVNGQASAQFFEDGHLIRAVYQLNGTYEVLTDLGPFSPIAPYPGPTKSFTANPFPPAGSGVFSTVSTWAKLQVAYFVRTADGAWTSGPVGGQKIYSNHFGQFQSAVDSVYAGAQTYAAGSATATIKQNDLQSYVTNMDLGDSANDAGYFNSFTPQLNGEKNLAALGTGSPYVDSYLYYYATPDSKSSGLQVADIRTFADGHTEIAAVTQTTHTVTPSIGTGAGHGTITPSSNQTIADGTTTTFTVTPATGYMASVSGSCNGTLNGTTYTTNAITADCTVIANFAQITITHTVTPSIGTGAGHGTITPSSNQTIADGTTTTFTVTPASGYTASVSGSCSGTLNGTTYTTNAIIADCTVIANFAQITHTVTPSIGTGAGHGTITPSSNQTIADGTTTTFTVTPASGYTASVGGSCSGTLNGTTYTTNAIIADCAVSANFDACVFSISPAGHDYDANAGAGAIFVTATSGCSWTATSNNSWITIDSGSPGTGSGRVDYSFSENTVASPRTGTITAAGKTFTITQTAGAPADGIPVSLVQGWNLFGWVSDTGYYSDATAPSADNYASGATLTKVVDIGDALAAAGLTGDNYLVVLGPSGAIYVPGSDFNTLTGLMPGMAYLVYMNEDTSITLPGAVLPSDSAVTMPEGWMLVAYLGDDGADPSIGFSCIDGLYDVILNGSGDIYVPGSDFNTLMNVMQSEGYLIHATGAGKLTYSCPD